MKKEVKYNPKSYVSVINISDNSIAMYSAMPVHILKKINDLERFKIDFEESIQELPFSNKKEISILEFNAKVLPEIKKALRHIERRKPQSFAIILTDSYALAKNTNEITTSIQEELVAINLQKKCNGVDVLSTEQQSFFCFASFLQTTTYAPNTKNHPKDTDFFIKKGVHFCLNTTKLIATVFQGMDFSKTKTFDINFDQLAASINLSDREAFDKKLKSIEELFIGAFKDLAIDDKDVGIWTFSDGFLDENHRDFKDSYNPHRNKKLKRSAEVQGDFEWKNWVSDLTRELFADYPPYYEVDKQLDVKKIIYHTFMYSIYKVYDIKKMCVNNANVTIGYIYHLLEQLKNP